MKPERKIRKLTAKAVFLAAVLSPLSAAEPEAVDAVEATEWRVGIAVLESGDADAGVRSAASVIPRLIYDRLSDIDTHRLSSNEREELAREYIDRRIMDSYRILGTLRDKRDSMFFDPNIDAARLRLQDVSIADAEVELAAWKNRKPSDIVVPATLPLRFPDSAEGTDLWYMDDADAEGYRLHSELDVLIGGNIVRVGDYFGIRVIAYSEGGEEVLWEGAVEEAGFDTAAAESAAAGRSLLLGRPWAAVVLTTSPPDAVIFADGTVVGVGSWSVSSLEPGPLTLEITAPGHRAQIHELSLSTGSTTELDYALDTVEQTSILVSSEPGGADVRLGSLWIGQTPLSVDLPDTVLSLTFEKEGFRSRTVPLYPDTQRFTVPLENVITDPDNELLLARRKLNNSIAWFSISLAPTFILLGVSQNYYYKALTTSDPAEFDSASDAYSLSRGLMWGSVGINALLLTNVLIRLARYLKAAENLAEQ